MTRKISIESVANAVLIVVCSWTAFVLYTLPSRAPVTAPAGYRQGDAISLTDVSLTQSESTVLLFLRSTCTFCTQSMPFYSTLTREIRASKKAGRIRVVVVTTDDRSIATEYLASHAVSVDEIVPETAPPQKVTGTPTIVLATRGGIVQKAWTGRLDDSRERELRKELGL